MKEKNMAPVSIIKCETYQAEKVYKGVREAVDLVDGLKKIIKPGQNVLLKVNLLSAQPPEKAITTHPLVVGAMVRLVKEAGGNPWVGDAAPSERVGGKDAFEVAGIRGVVEKEGGKIVNFSRTGYEKIKVPEAKQLKEIYIAKPILDADVVISLPKLKTHELAFLTGAVKNFFGCVPSSDRFRAHGLAQEEKFAQAVVDIYSVCRASFALMDAIVAMEGEGPSAGDPVKVGLLLASPDPVSLDIVASQVTGFKPSDILTSVDAVERRMGPSDFEDIKVVGSRIDEVMKSDFKKPSTYRGKVKRALIRAFTPVGLRFFRTFPAVKDSICTRCGICEERCPAGAIKMNPYPEFDYDRCIQCFCCHELCPSQAIYIKKNWLREKLSRH